MIHIEKDQEVEANKDYITCQEGEFNPYDFVLCKDKKNYNNIVMFLASQIKNTNDESSD